VDLKDKGLAGILIQFALKDPAYVFGFIANHFLATFVDGLLALPLIEPFNGIRAPINLYWMSWDGHLAWYNASLLILYLALISLGIGAAWKRWRWLGLLPLAFSLGYAAATAISRFSGWRYDFPADWICYFYFGVGFAELISQAIVLFGAKREIVFQTPQEDFAPGKSPSVLQGMLVAAIFALIGGLPWLVQNIASPRYPDQSTKTLIEKLNSLKGAPSPGELESFVSQPGTVLQTGRLLYPRFFSRNTGISSGNPLPAYAIRDYPRLSFVLLNQHKVQLIFPVKSYSGDFLHGADAIVLGCQKEDYVEVRLIAFPALNSTYTSTPLTESCSP
jgi:hypothetical protein